VPFKPGESGNRDGRPKGAKNKATLEIKEWATKFFESPKWRKSAEDRMVKGKGAHLESYLLALTYGKPTDRVELTGNEGKPLTVIFGGRYKQGDDGKPSGGS
jgi:hypothetical protein